MKPPFTIEQFLEVFATYNAAIWPAQIIAYALRLMAVAAVLSRTRLAPHFVSSIFALCQSNRDCPELSITA